MSVRYTIAVSLVKYLSAPNKRSVKRNCAIHGLVHPRLPAAEKAARALLALPSVEHVTIKRIDERLVSIWTKHARERWLAQRRESSRQGDPCPAWPRCRCIVQGYINRKEPTGCGRKPRTKR